MKKMISLVLTGILLSGCSYILPHKADVEQGNIIDAENTGRLHIGMTEGEVKEAMGNPVLTNIFTPNRLEYIYTFKQGYGDMHEKRLTCIFVHGKLREILRG